MLPPSLFRITLLVMSGVALRLLLVTTNSPPEGILGMMAGLVVLGQMLRR